MNELIVTLEQEWGKKRQSDLYLKDREHLGMFTKDWHLAISVFFRSLSSMQPDKYEILFDEQQIWAIRVLWGYRELDHSPSFSRFGVSFKPSYAELLNVFAMPMTAAKWANYQATGLRPDPDIDLRFIHMYALPIRDRIDTEREQGIRALDRRKWD